MKPSSLQVTLSSLRVVKCCVRGQGTIGRPRVCDKYQCKVVLRRNNTEPAVSSQEQNLGVNVGSSLKSLAHCKDI